VIARRVGLADVMAAAMQDSSQMARRLDIIDGLRINRELSKIQASSYGSEKAGSDQMSGSVWWRKLPMCLVGKAATQGAVSTS
jgi:hypothetical protein